MSTPTDLYRCFMDSPMGRLRLDATGAGLVGVYFPEHRRLRTPPASEVERHPVLKTARRQLEEYFAGSRTAFDTPLAPAGMRGGTSFQHAVWDALLAIPFGETRTYGDIARLIDRPRAVRAVGAANGLNPVSIFVPCHRVVGADGSLTGYAGGIDEKRWLLAHERRERRSAASQR